MKLTYYVRYIFHIYIIEKLLWISKYTNIFVGNIPWYFFFYFVYEIPIVPHHQCNKRIWHSQHNFSYSSNSIIDNYNLKMIFINDISFRFGDTEIISYNLPLYVIILMKFLLLYNKSIIDIWNINANINVRGFDHIFVE